MDAAIFSFSPLIDFASQIITDDFYRNTYNYY